MGLADEFERRLERVVEGFFSKAFRSDIQPAEIGRRLLREMESGKNVSVGAVYVPNLYRIRLTPSDADRLEGLLPTLSDEFLQLLKEHTRERNWRLTGPLHLSFEPDESLKTGKFEVEGSHQAGGEAEAGGEPAAVVQLVDSDAEQKWTLEGGELTIGRLEECDIVVVDPNASRRHARLVNREGEWWIEDLGATNGTLVNDMLVKERRLRPGDRIRIGTTDLVFTEETGASKARE